MIIEGGLILRLIDDIKAVLNRDPAATNSLEVFLLYPGIHSIIIHRISHWLFLRGMRFLARLFSSVNRFVTGIDIHPGAKIGKGLFIDHGMGVVIGETVEIGDNVTIYQGATLGGTGKDVGKRHPTIGNNVVISCGAKVLGPIHIGDNSKIGAGAVVLENVPPNCTVVGVPGKIVKKDNNIIRNNTFEIDLDQVSLPDPVQEQIRMLSRKIAEMQNQIMELQDQLMDKAG